MLDEYALEKRKIFVDRIATDPTLFDRLCQVVAEEFDYGTTGEGQKVGELLGKIVTALGGKTPETYEMLARAWFSTTLLAMDEKWPELFNQ